MNKDKFEGRWREFKGKIKEKWGKLTDNDLTQINGKYEQFLGALQNRYGYERERAEREFNSWNWGETRGAKDFEEGETSSQFESEERGQNRPNQERNRFNQDANQEKNRPFREDRDLNQPRERNLEGQRGPFEREERGQNRPNQEKNPKNKNQGPNKGQNRPFREDRDVNQQKDIDERDENNRDKKRKAG